MWLLKLNQAPEISINSFPSKFFKNSTLLKSLNLFTRKTLWKLNTFPLIFPFPLFYLFQRLPTCCAAEDQLIILSQCLKLRQVTRSSEFFHMCVFSRFFLQNKRTYGVNGAQSTGSTVRTFCSKIKSIFFRTIYLPSAAFFRVYLFSWIFPHCYCFAIVVAIHSVHSCYYFSNFVTKNFGAIITSGALLFPSFWMIFSQGNFLLYFLYRFTAAVRWTLMTKCREMPNSLKISHEGLKILQLADFELDFYAVVFDELWNYVHSCAPDRFTRFIWSTANGH